MFINVFCDLWDSLKCGAQGRGPSCPDLMMILAVATSSDQNQLEKQVIIQNFGKSKLDKLFSSSTNMRKQQCFCRKFHQI